MNNYIKDDLLTCCFMLNIICEILKLILKLNVKIFYEYKQTNLTILLH